MDRRPESSGSVQEAGDNSTKQVNRSMFCCLHESLLSCTSVQYMKVNIKKLAKRMQLFLLVNLMELIDTLCVFMVLINKTQRS